MPVVRRSESPAVKFCGECGTALTAQAALGRRPATERRSRAAARLGALRRSRRASPLRPRTATPRRHGAPLALLRHLPPAHRALRRHCREVHRRRGHGGLGYADGDGGRRGACSAGRARPRRRRHGARRRGRSARLRARAGVLTGEAAVTIGAEGQGMVAGDLVNTASRIQSIAEPGTVVVGETTRRATDQAIVYADAGLHELKGKTELVSLWRRCASSPVSAARSSRQGSRRRSSGGTASCAGSRICSTRARTRSDRS